MLRRETGERMGRKDGKSVTPCSVVFQSETIWREAAFNYKIINTNCKLHLRSLLTQAEQTAKTERKLRKIYRGSSRF